MQAGQRKSLLLVILTISLLVFSQNALKVTAAQVKAGTTCKKLNSTTVSGKTTFICLKVQGKLIWKVAPTPTIKPTPTASSAPANNQDRYQLGLICDGVKDAMGAKDRNGLEMVCIQGSDGKYAWFSRTEYEKNRTAQNPTQSGNSNSNQGSETKPEAKPENGKPCTKEKEVVLTSAGIELVCTAGVDKLLFWYQGDQTPKAALFGNSNIRASMLEFPRPSYNQCKPEPGQEYQYYRTGKTLVIDPFNSQHLFVGVERLGIFESSNGGATWIPASTEGILFDMKKSDNTVCFKEIYGMKYDPKVKDRVYLLLGGTGTVNAGKWQARGSGLYVSNDNGKNWELLTTPDMNSYTASLAIDPNDSETLYLGVMSSPQTSTGADQSAVFVTSGIIYKSTNGGKNWVELPTGWGKHTRALSIRVNPNDSKNIILAVFQTSSGRDPNNKAATGTNLKPGYYESKDGGASWSAIGSSPIHQLSVFYSTISINGQGIIYTPQHEGYESSYYSTDGGKTFVAISGKQLMLPIFVPNSNTTAFGILERENFTTLDRLMKTTDGGKSWSFVAYTPAEMQFTLADQLTREQARPQNLSFDPNNYSIMYLNGGGGKVAKSTDGGVTWTLLSTWETLPKMNIVAR